MKSFQINERTMIMIYVATTLIIIAMALLVEFMPRRLADSPVQEEDTWTPEEIKVPEEEMQEQEQVQVPVTRKLEITVDPTMFASVQNTMEVVKDSALVNFMKLYCHEHINREGHELVACVIGGFTVNSERLNVSVKEVYEDSAVQYVLYEIEMRDDNYTVSGVYLFDSSGVVFSAAGDSIQFLPLEEVPEYDKGLDTEDVAALNEVGIAYYNQDDYELAAALFYNGTLLDGKTDNIEKLALCYYNLACTISILSETHENYNNIEDCLYYLKRSFELSTDRIARAQEDPDFDNIRNTQAFMEMMKGIR